MKWRRLAHLYLMAAVIPMAMGCDGKPGAIETGVSPDSAQEILDVEGLVAAAEPAAPAEKAAPGQDYSASSSCSCNGVLYTCANGSCFCSNGSGYCGGGGSMPTNPFPTNPFPSNTGSASSSCSCNGILYVCSSGSCFCSNGSGYCGGGGSSPGNTNPGNNGGYPTCGPGAIDPDRDGWGWENNQSCRVVGGGTSPGNTGSVSSSCSCNGVLYTCPSGSCFCSNGTGYCR